MRKIKALILIVDIFRCPIIYMQRKGNEKIKRLHREIYGEVFK